jgi:hypothetical protein
MNDAQLQNVVVQLLVRNRSIRRPAAAAGHKGEPIINLKTAKLLAIDLPPTLLSRAGEVIK